MVHHLHIRPQSSPGQATATIGGHVYTCRIGRAGIAKARFKREGDRRTPSGTFRLRYLLWRQDRVPPPISPLPVVAIKRHDGWCDDPGAHHYNRPVCRRRFMRRCEDMWRDDHLYDLVLVIGYNDGKNRRRKAGSAIFIHLDNRHHSFFRPSVRDGKDSSRRQTKNRIQSPIDRSIKIAINTPISPEGAIGATKGCIAFSYADLSRIIPMLSPLTRLTIHES